MGDSEYASIETMYVYTLAGLRAQQCEIKEM